MACCQGGKLHAPDGEIGVWADEQRVRPFACEGCEDRIDVAAAARVEDLDMQPHGAPGGFHLARVKLRARRIARIHEDRDAGHCGHQLAQQLQPLGYQLAEEKVQPRQVAAGPGEAGDEPSLTGSSGIANTIGTVVVAALAAMAGAVPPLVTMAATCLRTRSAAMAGSRLS